MKDAKKKIMNAEQLERTHERKSRERPTFANIGRVFTLYETPKSTIAKKNLKRFPTTPIMRILIVLCILAIQAGCFDLQMPNRPEINDTEQYIQVSAGELHTCALKTGGSPICWGSNSFGQSSPPDELFDQIAAGGGPSGSHTCGIRIDGSIACWGDNDKGQSTPPDGVFQHITSGGEHSCAISTDGSVDCWGSDSSGETVPPDGQFLQISTRWTYTCGVKTDNTVICWGGATEEDILFVGESVKEVAAGSEGHVCAILQAGTVLCSGADSSGETDAPEGEFEQISAGNCNNCAVQTDGSIECWGLNGNGQSSPIEGDYDSVAAGGGHTCGLRTDGTIVCWGRDDLDQLDVP